VLSDANNLSLMHSYPNDKPSNLKKKRESYEVFLKISSSDLSVLRFFAVHMRVLKTG
jgi:hypothetical protein